MWAVVQGKGANVLRRGVHDMESGKKNWHGRVGDSGYQDSEGHGSLDFIM